MGNKVEHIKIVVDGFEANKNDNDILQELFTSGVEFGDLRTVFNDIIKEKGLRLSTKERKIKTEDLMEGVEIETVEQLLSAVAMLEDALKVPTTKAMGSLRTWAKEHSKELPKAPRVATVRKVGFSGHYKKILDFALENRDADKKTVVKFCNGESIPDAYATQAMNIIHFAKVWAGEIENDVVESVETAAEPAAPATPKKKVAKKAA